jgi:hypothetical protein
VGQDAPAARETASSEMTTEVPIQAEK